MQPFNQKEKIENVICEDLSKVLVLKTLLVLNAPVSVKKQKHHLIMDSKNVCNRIRKNVFVLIE